MAPEAPRSVRWLFYVLIFLVAFTLGAASRFEPTLAALPATEALDEGRAPAHATPRPRPEAWEPEPLLRVITVEVRPGDTLSAITWQWGVSEACILSANPELGDPDLLTPGQVLWVPLWEVETWRARGGETLQELADYHGFDLMDLALVNGFELTFAGDQPEPLVLDPGQVVYLPTEGIPANGVYHREAVVRTAEGWQCVALMPSPVRGRISQVWGGPGGRHKGLDIAAPLGTPVYCPRDGTVVDVGIGTAWDREASYGLYIRVEHPNGVETLYAHLSRVHVVVGQEVRLGDILGEVGSTGRSTGPHLHFEVRVRGELVNPRTVLRGEGP